MRSRRLPEDGRIRMHRWHIRRRRGSLSAGSAIRAMAVGGVAMLVLSCGDGAVEPVPPPAPVATTVTVTPGSAALTALEETARFTAEVRDQNGQVMAGAAVAWASSDASVASVDASGLVTAAANGGATITATAGSVSGTAAVTVEQVVSAVAVSPATDTLVAFGDTVRLVAEATDANGHGVTDSEFSWSSSDTLVARVDDSGLVESLAEGEAVVTATASGVGGDVGLTVVSPLPTTLALSPDTARLTALDQTVQLAAEVREQSGRVMAEAFVSWSSGDTLVATVDSVGLVTAVGGGTTTVTAAAGDVTDTIVVMVMQSTGSVLVSPSEGTIAVGDTLRLAAEAFDANGHRVGGAVFTWSSSNAGAAHVDETGLVSGVAEGTARITAAADDATGVAEITVENPDRAALVALYEATDGPNWPDNTNWLTDAPLGEWYGVDTDASGRVARLVLRGRWDHDRDQLAQGLRGELPPQLGDLSNLTELTLSWNALSGPIPTWLGNLPELRSLDLFINNFTGPIPPELGDLANLQRLNLGHNFSLSSPIPPELGNLANLEHLYLGRLDLTGTIPPELGNLTKLKSLGLNHCGGPLGGPIPPELGNLTSLTSLSLQYTNLTGTIPPELGNLTNLEFLHLEGNDFTGPIPPELGNLRRLRDLSLGQNQLTGPIPPELGNLTRLTDLWLPANDLSGPLPASMLQLEQLGYLSLTGTKQGLSGNERLCVPGTPAFAAWLQGIDSRRSATYRNRGGHDVGPDSLCNASDVIALRALYDATGGTGWTRSDGWLDDDDLGEWHGVAVDSTGRVKSIDLVGNGLTGELPSGLSELGVMTVLRIGDNALAGRLPLSLTRIPLREFNYAATGLCAPTEESFQTWLDDIPLHRGSGAECAPLSERDMLTELYKSTNGHNWIDGRNWLTSAPIKEWHGVELDANGHVSSLVLQNNSLTGEIPIELGYLTSLQRLNLDGNSLSGPILPEIGDLESLRVLNLEWNALSGAIPPELGELDSLESLRLGGNDLTGPIPPELGDLADLQALYLRWNALSGPIPPELGDLGSLERLYLGGNSLSGPIPPELGDLADLRDLHLRGNALSGPIPPELGDLERLAYLDLASNALSGPIPPELGDLADLRLLYLGWNTLSGPIPPELGELMSLERLYLAANSLSGSIPPEMGDLERLAYLDLASNALSGAIPPEFGNLAMMSDLHLTSNELSGPIPPEVGGMSMLRQLNVASNSGMKGALPTELTALTSLETLLAGGTGLCVPVDAGLQAWLKGINKRWIARCTESVAYLTQAVQSRVFPVPLVAREKALLRVFPTAQESTDAGIPPVRARFYRDGRETHVVEIPRQSTPIPTEVQEGDLAKSANAEVPGGVVQPGLEMVIEIDPGGTLDPALGVARRIPEEGRLEVEVQAMPLFNLTLIPFLSTVAHDSTIVDLVKAMEADPDAHEMFSVMHTLLPVEEVAVTAHEPVLSSNDNAFDLLRQTEVIRALEGGTGHYMGMIPNPSGTVSGVAYISGRSSFAAPNAGTIAHELGHNMSLGHAPCGVWGEPSYPYSDGSVGAWGYDFGNGGKLMDPSNVDLMSYCQPQWISDYHFANALRFRLHDERAQQAPSAALSTRSILLWGGVGLDTVPFLEPAFVVDAPPMLPDSAGEWRITGSAADGRRLFDLDFTMPEVADSDGAGGFAFTLPTQSAWAEDLASITLSGPTGEAILDDTSNNPMAILRNPRSGQVQGFLRDLPPATQAAMDTTGQTAGPALTVLFSRGLPDAAAWRQ